MSINNKIFHKVNNKISLSVRNNNLNTFVDSKNYYTSWENVPTISAKVCNDKSIKNALLYKIDFELEELKNINAEIKGKNSFSQINMYDLYNVFLRKRINFFWSYNRDDISIKTLDTDSRFLKINDLQWFRRDIYKKFVIRQILTNPLSPRRNFRVLTNLKCLINLKNEFKVCHLEQISDAGFVIRSNGLSIDKFLKNNDDIEFIFSKIPDIIDDEMIIQMKSQQLLNSNNIQNLKIDARGDSFVFIPYNLMNIKNHPKEIYQSIQKKHLNFLHDVYNNFCNKNSFKKNAA